MIDVPCGNTPTRAEGPALRNSYSLPYRIGGSDYVSLATGTVLGGFAMGQGLAKPCPWPREPVVECRVGGKVPRVYRSRANGSVSGAV